MNILPWRAMLLVAVVPIVDASILYPYGTDVKDITTPIDDDGSSPPVQWINNFNYYGNSYTNFYINNDGSISFLKAETYDTTTVSPPEEAIAVCAFCSDINNVKGGTIWYRQTTDAQILSDLAKTAQQFEMFDPDFTPTFALIVTWKDVQPYAENSNETNTFQAVLAASNETSLAMLLYETVTWVQDTTDYGENYPEADPETLPKMRTQAGFLSGDNNTFYLLEGSRSYDFINVTLSSNIGTPGKYLFRVDTDIQTPTLSTTTDATTTMTASTSEPPHIATTETTTLSTTTDATTAMTASTSEPPHIGTSLTTAQYIGIGITVGAVVIFVVTNVIVLKKSLQKHKGRVNKGLRCRAGKGKGKISPTYHNPQLSLRNIRHEDSMLYV